MAAQVLLVAFTRVTRGGTRQGMRAWKTVELTGPSGLRLVDVAAPSFGPGEVKVRVHATALNRADLLQTRGLYPAPPGAPAHIPGLEYAGEIIELGSRVTRWKVGDRVMGLVAGGAWAEELVASEREVAPMPANFSYADAAALPEAYLTAWDAIVTQGGATIGSRVLIHAVGSGVGTAATQICRVLGARAVGTGRNEVKLARAKALGLEGTILLREGFAKEVHALLGGVDVALDLVGGDWVGETIDALAPRGTLMLVGLVAGASAQVPLGKLLARRARVIGTTMRARPLEEKIAAAQVLARTLVPLFESQQLKPVVDAVLPMASLVTALERLDSNDSFGKIVLTW
jgi:putative PIG3 family NAD(P)H quinone oxidoreductase